MSDKNWGEYGYADSPEAILVQSWSDEELRTFLCRTTGVYYGGDLRGSRSAAGRRGALNRVAIRELHKLAGKPYKRANYNGRQEKVFPGDVG